MKFKSLAALAITAVISSNASALTTIDTTGSWNGSDFIFPFGETNTATYGQTFTVGADNVMDSFTFWMEERSGAPTEFGAYVMAWDGNKATGPVLFSTGMLTTTNNGGAGGFEQFTINTGGLSLSSGSQYVAFFNASNYFDGVDGTSNMAGLSGANVYADGQFVFLNNGSNFGQVTTSNWNKDHQGAGSDLAFVMEFSGVPAPSILALMGLGLVGVGFSRRRQA